MQAPGTAGGYMPRFDIIPPHCGGLFLHPRPRLRSRIRVAANTAATAPSQSGPTDPPGKRDSFWAAFRYRQEMFMTLPSLPAW